jgi:AcrR family transcriptional regulator
MPAPLVDVVKGASATEERIPYSVAARELLHTSLLDAACHELQSRRWADITMADVALTAGVSRQTLYNEFGSRNEFAQVLVMREADSLLDAVARAVDTHHDDPVKALAAAFDVSLTAAAENPLLHTIVRGEGAEDLLALFTTQGQPLVERAAEYLAGVMLAAWPLLTRHDAELLSECLVRLAISHAALPKGPPTTTASSIAELLGPYVERLLAGETARGRL